MKLSILTVCDTALALLLVAFCCGVGGAWLAIPAAALAIWALGKRNDGRESPSERAQGMRRVRTQLDKDMRDPSGIAPASAHFDPRLRP